MTDTFVGLMLGVGFATWVYSKLYRQTGGDAKSAGIVAAIAGVAACGIMILLLRTFFKS